MRLYGKKATKCKEKRNGRAGTRPGVGWGRGVGSGWQGAMGLRNELVSVVSERDYLEEEKQRSGSQVH
jgi:hypothetical protein